MSWTFFVSSSTTHVALVGVLTALTLFKAVSNFSAELSGRLNSASAVSYSTLTVIQERINANSEKISRRGSAWRP